MRSRAQERLVGAAFGSLVVISEEPGGFRDQRRVRCRCACGGIKVVLVTSLRAGLSRSCGCRRWRSDADRTVSATAHLALMLPPLVVGQLTAIALASGVTPAQWMRSAIESFVCDDEARARVQAVQRRRQPPGATTEVRLRVTPETREQALGLARTARQTLTCVCLLALDAASRESGTAPLVAPLLPQADPERRSARVPGIASRVGGIGLHQSAHWRARFPIDPEAD